MLVSICLLIVSFDLQKGAQFCENTVEHGTVFKGTSGIRQRHFLIGRMECVQLFQQSCAVIFRVVLVGNIGKQPGEGCACVGTAVSFESGDKFPGAPDIVPAAW